MDDVGVKPRSFMRPMLWFGAYEEREILDGTSVEVLRSRLGGCAGNPASYWARSINPTESCDRYKEKINSIKEYIAEGDTYQVNYTFKLRYDFFGDPLSLFLDLNERQKVSYAAFIKNGPQSILSISPEIFFRREGESIMARPMKGTAGRADISSEDEGKAQALFLSQKNRAENIMIVDLFRNDLGRICEKGSVTASSLFNLERYETLHQMTSTVEGRLSGRPGWQEIFKAMYPSGSVTGAPKIRTMQIIRELEEEARGVYTGAIGFIDPDERAVFNIPIRTLVIDEKNKTGEMGIGSGVVIDSDPEDEYDECMLKSRFFTGLERDYGLIETLLWSGKTGYCLLPYHLKRLRSSAAYFRFKYDEKVLIAKLKAFEDELDEAGDRKLRVLLMTSGEFEITHEPIAAPQAGPVGQQRIAISSVQTDPDNLFLYHKTTNRVMYDEEYRRGRENGFFDIVFTNREGEVTEGAVSNVFAVKDGIWQTPPVSCGLLNGVYRQHLLKTKGSAIKERILTLNDLLNSDRIYFANSVRGLTEVVLEGSENGLTNSV